LLGRDKRILELKAVSGPDFTELDAIGKRRTVVRTRHGGAGSVGKGMAGRMRFAIRYAACVEAFPSGGSPIPSGRDAADGDGFFVDVVDLINNDLTDGEVNPALPAS